MAAVQASISVNIQSQQEGPAAGVAIELDFDGVPGAGESIAIQEADTDADDFYITPTTTAYTISTFNANNNARSDLIPTGGKFLRVVRTKGANNAGIIVRVTRLA
jgi:hypothetical protein